MKFLTKDAEEILCGIDKENAEMLSENGGILNLPDSVTSIGWRALSNQYSERVIEVYGKNVKHIESEPFRIMHLYARVISQMLRLSKMTRLTTETD